MNVWPLLKLHTVPWKNVCSFHITTVWSLALLYWNELISRCNELILLINLLQTLETVLPTKRIECKNERPSGEPFVFVRLPSYLSPPMHVYVTLGLIVLKLQVVYTESFRGKVLFCYNMTLNFITRSNRIFTENVTVCRLVQKFSLFYGTPKVHHRVHKSLPLVPIRSYLSPINTLTQLYIHT
jgi:hypothetical protein